MALFLIIALTAVHFIPDEPTQLLVIIPATIVFLIAGFIALKFEVDAGYYECKKCHHRFTADYKQVLGAIHMGTTRYLKCPECHKRSWTRKVMSK